MTLSASKIIPTFLSIIVLASGFSVAASENKDNLQEATSALEQARNALDAAQLRLIEAQGGLAQSTEEKKPGKNVSNVKGKLYKWIDDQGNISYQDSPPPKDVEILDSDVLKEIGSSDKSVKELTPSNEDEYTADGSKPVMIYTADNCKPCQSVVLFLTQKQVPFIERDIRSDRKARERLSNLSKQITVPSLFIGPRIIQGDSKPVITRALEEAGYLKPD